MPRQGTTGLPTSRAIGASYCPCIGIAGADPFVRGFYKFAMHNKTLLLRWGATVPQCLRWLYGRIAAFAPNARPDAVACWRTSKGTSA